MPLFLWLYAYKPGNKYKLVMAATFSVIMIAAALSRHRAINILLVYLDKYIYVCRRGEATQAPSFVIHLLLRLTVVR